MSALAKIHIAKKELNLHDDDYRSILKRLTGQESAKALSDRQAGVVIEEFKRMGWKPKLVQGGRQAAAARKVSAANHPSARKARALWISLYQLGAITDSSEKALEAFARRQLKCERMAWADQQQMFKLIEALKSMAERNGWSQDVAGIDPASQTTVLKQRLEVAIRAKQGK